MQRSTQITLSFASLAEVKGLLGNAPLGLCRSFGLTPQLLRGLDGFRDEPSRRLLRGRLCCEAYAGHGGLTRALRDAGAKSATPIEAYPAPRVYALERDYDLRECRAFLS